MVNSVRILGKASKEIVRNLSKRHPNQVDNSDVLFFIDYSGADIRLKTKFDTLLTGEELQLVNEIAAIELVAVFDNLGNTLKAIPKGHQAIAKFKFTPTTPPSVKQLPVIRGWRYNPDFVTLADHTEIHLKPIDTVLISLYKATFAQVKATYIHTNTVSKKDFLLYLRRSLQTPTQETEKVFLELQSLGLLREEEGNLILAEPEETYRAKK